MRVYRVAHRKTKDTRTGTTAGPYGAKFWEGMGPMLDAHACGPAHPAPWEDVVLGDVDHDEVCAFDSEAALEAWFESFLTPLHEAGFAVHVYEVASGSFRGPGLEGQVVFTARRAELVEVHDLPTADEQLALF